MRIKITKKSDNKKAWYNDGVGQEFQILMHQYTNTPVYVVNTNCGGDGVVCLINNKGVWGDYEFVKERE